MTKNYHEELLAEVESWFSDCTDVYAKLSNENVRRWYDYESNEYRFKILRYGKHKLNIDLSFAPEEAPFVTISSEDHTKDEFRRLSLNDETFWQLKGLGLFDQLFIGVVDKLAYDLGYSLDETKKLLERVKPTVKEIAENA